MIKERIHETRKDRKKVEKPKFEHMDDIFYSWSLWQCRKLLPIIIRPETTGLAWGAQAVSCRPLVITGHGTGVA